jgi:predicted RNase H-like nuclease (RuvC/YqgF family)
MSKRRITCFIPLETYEAIEASDYDNVTDAVNMALKCLFDEPDKIKVYDDKIKSYKDKIMVLQNHEIELQAHLEEKEDRLKDLQKHNETLKIELDKASQREEEFKVMQNNYFLQVQTLINQKAIEAPGEKKKPFWKFW